MKSQQQPEESSGSPTSIREHFTEEIERFLEIGRSMLGLVGEDISNDIPDVSPALLRWDIMLHGIRENNESDPVVFADSGECKDRGNLGRYFVFGFVFGSFLFFGT